jgi:hypothetical protein
LCEFEAYDIIANAANCTTTLPENATLGETVSFTVEANVGYTLGKVTLDGVELTPVDGVYTFTMPNNEVTVDVETTKNVYAITEASSNCLTTLPSSATYGDEISFTVTGNTGYKVDSVAIADTVLEAVDGVYTFTMPAENVTVSIETSKIDYTISQNGSNFTSTLPTIANHEDVVIFKVEADADYAVSKVTLNGTELTLANGVYIFTMPAGDVTVDVETYLTVEIGDVNKDGRVNIKDATMIQKYIARLIDFDATQNIVADTNDDGVINVMDATEIQKYIAHIIPEL